MIQINADDYGFTEQATAGIIRAWELGYIDTTTACSNGECFASAIALAREKHMVDRIGLHINLTEGRPLTDAISQDSYFCRPDGSFHGLFPCHKRLEGFRRQEVEDEIQKQIDMFRGAGLIISHVDSHHHIHTGMGIAPAVISVLKRNNLKMLRISRNVGAMSSQKRLAKKMFNLWLTANGFECSKFFGSIEDYISGNRIDYYKKQKGICEIMVHPVLNEEGILLDNRGESYEAYGPELVDLIRAVGRIV